jgi:ABC-type antimicrobial peptide transport system permease subunit
MAETFFSVNDLLRRKLQTALAVIGLALSVASTLFLLLLGDKLGFGILSVAENRLTSSFSAIFSRFITFIGLLVFVVGLIIISFLVLVMMSQRTKDIGLMKAAGCPNNLVFGYFMNELIMVSLAGCLLGVVIGVVADYASVSLLNSIGFQVAQGSVNIWMVAFVFVVFLILSLTIGAKPILDATRIKPVIALSPSFSFGLAKESDFKGVSKAGLTVKMAVRSLFRRKSASFRIIVCLTAVFILVTVSVAGGIIANRTTKNWTERAVGRNVILIAHKDVCRQYGALLSKFHQAETISQINFTKEEYLIPENILDELRSMADLATDSRLVIETQIKEVQAIVFGETTGETTTVGDSRKGISLVIGVEPGKVLNDWFLDGELLRENQSSDAMIGDTVAAELFTRPLVQNVTVLGENFGIVGVCVDPLNNGNVTYVPLETLQNLVGVTRPNIILARTGASASYEGAVIQIRANVTALNYDFEVVELNEILDRSLSFLDYTWSAIMLLPLLSLSAATLCLIGYVVLSMNEQRQEFAILRAVGAKPKTILKIVATQTLLILLSSWAAGISLGIMITLLTLIPEPFVTAYTIIDIASWLLLAWVAIFIISLYPALRFARKPILELMA